MATADNSTNHASKFQQQQRMREVYEYILQCRSKAECITFILDKGWFKTERQAHNLYQKAINLLHTENEVDIVEDRAFVRAKLRVMMQAVDRIHKGKISGIHAMAKILKLYGEMLGIEPPKRIEVTGKDGIDLNGGKTEIDFTKLSDSTLKELYDAGSRG